MNYKEFLEKIIDDGIEAAKADYIRPDQKGKLEGSIEGFEACRGKTPTEIREILDEACRKSREALDQVHEGEISDDEYWKVRCRELEIEWVANCVSAILMNHGIGPLAAHLPTARAFLKAAEVVGVKGASS